MRITEKNDEYWHIGDTSTNNNQKKEIIFDISNKDKDRIDRIHFRVEENYFSDLSSTSNKQRTHLFSVFLEKGSVDADCNPNHTDSTGNCNISCEASSGCEGITPNVCSLNLLKKCDSNCQEVSSCGDGTCNCGENTSNCLQDCSLFPSPSPTPDPSPTPAPDPLPPPTDYPELTLLKTPCSFKIYIIINQKKKWIPTPEVFETLGYQWAEITIIEKNQLDLIQDYEDNLIRAINDYKVYLIVNGIKRHLPNLEIFLNYGFNWDEVKEVNQETINQYTESNLIKESKKQEIYYLDPARKIKRWLRSPEIFNSYNNKWEDIQVISEYEMDHYPTSNLIKLNQSNDVYLTEGNKKRLIKSVEEFEKEGLDWNLIMRVRKVEMGWFGE